MRDWKRRGTYMKETGIAKLELARSLTPERKMMLMMMMMMMMTTTSNIFFVALREEAVGVLVRGAEEVSGLKRKEGTRC
jgi:hypothetical protein